MADEKAQVSDLAHEQLDSEPPWVWDHRSLLYWGGAAAHAGQATDLIERGTLGVPDPARLPVILKIREAIIDQLRAGGSRYTAASQVKNLRKFYAWADKMHQTLTIDSVASQFLNWTDYLEQRRRSGAIKRITAYTEAQRVAALLECARP